MTTEKLEYYIYIGVLIPDIHRVYINVFYVGFFPKFQKGEKTLVHVWGGIAFFKIASRNPVNMKAWFSIFLFPRQIWLETHVWLSHC